MKKSWYLLALLVFLVQADPMACAQEALAGDGKVAARPENTADDALRVKLPTGEQNSPAAKFEVALSPSSAKSGDVVTVTIETVIKDGWHICSVDEQDGAGLPTKIQIDAANLEPIDQAFEPSVAPGALTIGEQTQHIQSGSFSWTRKYRMGEGGIRSISGSIKFVACNEKNCLPPKELDFSLTAVPKKSSPIVEAEPQFEAIGKPIEIALEACSVKRPKAKLSLLGVLFGSRTEKLSLKGTAALGEEELTIYLPKKRKYTLKNTGAGNTRFENTSTYFSIDQDQDGVIGASESLAANRPFRVADLMYQITRIDQDSAKLTVQQVAAPLSGTIVGRKVAPFELTTVDGEKITHESVLGKVTFLDVWAVT